MLRCHAHRELRVDMSPYRTFGDAVACVVSCITDLLTFFSSSAFFLASSAFFFASSSSFFCNCDSRLRPPSRNQHLAVLKAADTHDKRNHARVCMHWGADLP